MEKITDIFGNIVVNKNIPILLIKAKITDGLLTQIKNYDNDSIWELNMNNINDILKKNNIDPEKYKTFGNYWYPHIRCHFYITIILANLQFNFISYPKDFINIGGYNDGYIWKPVCNKNYTELGLVYNKIKPDVNDFCTISQLYTIEYNGKYDLINNYTNYNEFYLLGSSSIQRKTIYRARFIKKNKILKIKNLFNNKFLNSNEFHNVVFSKIPTDAVYTTDGEIKINDKCLERIYNSENNLTVSLKECNETSAQKWFPFGIPDIVPNPEYNLISQYDLLYLTLLSDGDDEIKKNIIATEFLLNNKKQIFKFENIRNNKVIFNKNNSNIMLVESNNPWYINKSNNIPQKYYNNKTYENDNFEDLNKNNDDSNNGDLISGPNTIPNSYALYYKNNMTDNSLRHSYNNFTKCSQYDNKKKKSNKIEKFTNNDKHNVNNNKQMIVILLIVIIFIVYYFINKF